MTIGELSRRSGLAVRTLRYYADAGVLPEAGRSEAGYRLFGADAVPRARLVRTLRELGVGLDDVCRVLREEASVEAVAAAHVDAIDAQIRVLRLQRSVLALVVRSEELATSGGRNTHSHPKELERMTDLATMTAQERRRILDGYLDAVFGDTDGAVVDKLRMGAPELPEDPTPDQVAAWVEVAQLLQDPDYVATSRRMAERARSEGPEPDPAQFEVGKAVGEHAGNAQRDGVDPSSPEGLAVVERLEALGSQGQDRAAAADRIEAFSDKRVARYWSLVAVVNGWPQDQGPSAEAVVDAWLWYAKALRAHA